MNYDRELREALARRFEATAQERRTMNRTVTALVADSDRLECSFCGKSHRQVRKLIAGPRVYICDECVALAREILAEEDAGGDGG